MRTLLRNKYIKIRERYYRVRDSIFGHNNYKKFMIISDSRTGSTLLQNMLNFHPRIVAKGELFKVMDGKNDSQVLSEFYRKYPNKLLYVGFKLFYHHPFNGVSEIMEND